ncbi:MAG: Uma2 family endonuclease [Isosphaeraceae bacterium]
MSTTSQPPARPLAPPEADPFRYGWRLVKTTLPDGTKGFDQVPLTLEDVLHPEEGDFIIQTPKHVADWVYLNQVFQARLADNPDAVVTSDCRISWGVPGPGAHGPDVAVFFGVRHRYDWGTFDVAAQGARPALVIEVVSPDDRDNDVTVKVNHYHRAGVPQYIIVDDLGTVEDRRLELVGYRDEPQGYRRQRADERGWLWLGAVRLWLGVVGDRVACFDPETALEIADYATLTRDLAEANQEIAAANQRSLEAQARAEAEAQERAALEARLRDLEAELRRLRGEP